MKSSHGYDWKSEGGSGIVLLDCDEHPIARVIAMADESGDIENHVYVLTAEGDWDHRGEESSSTTAKRIALAESLIERVDWCRQQMQTALMALEEGHATEAKELLLGDPIQRAFDLQSAVEKMKEALGKGNQMTLSTPGGASVTLHRTGNKHKN